MNLIKFLLQITVTYIKLLLIGLSLFYMKYFDLIQIFFKLLLKLTMFLILIIFITSILNYTTFF